MHEVNEFLPRSLNYDIFTKMHPINRSCDKSAVTRKIYSLRFFIEMKNTVIKNKQRWRPIMVRINNVSM